MGRREQKLAKAARLQEWAEKREAKAAAALAQADEIAGLIPMGQPILVGHHSEGRARRDQSRIHSSMNASGEHATKAKQMRGRAENIKAAAEQAIYSDDVNAVERLRERVATLTAERELMKSTNALFRKEHKERLKLLSAFQRDLAMPYQAFALANLTGNINRYKKRLEEMDGR